MLHRGPAPTVFDRQPPPPGVVEAALLDLLSGTPTERTQLAMVRERPLPFPPEPLAWLGIRLTDWSMHRADHHQGRRTLLLKGLDAVGMGFAS